MNIGAVNGTGPPTDMTVASAVPAQGALKEHRSSGQYEEQKSMENERMRQMVEEMQRHMDTLSVSLEFTTYGEKGEKIAIIVTDKESGEVIREIPSKEIQGLYAKMREINGIIFNSQA
ncbi:MAG: flagellar protein FlaG [Syntrophales bacterium]